MSTLKSSLKCREPGLIKMEIMQKVACLLAADVKQIWALQSERVLCVCLILFCCCALCFSSLCNALLSRLRAEATGKHKLWNDKMCLCVALLCMHYFHIIFGQERVFLSVSNYIFTVIFVGEMMIKVTLTVQAFSDLTHKEELLFLGCENKYKKSNSDGFVCW